MRMRVCVHCKYKNKTYHSNDDIIDTTVTGLIKHTAHALIELK